MERETGAIFAEPIGLPAGSTTKTGVPQACKNKAPIAVKRPEILPM
jgi:hypothetical protein